MVEQVAVRTGTTEQGMEALRGDPYVRLLTTHLDDPSLFTGGPENARARQRELLVPFLDFFLRHDTARGHHRGLFARKGLLDDSGGVRADVDLPDLAALRIHSDDLRADGQRRRLVPGAAADGPGTRVYGSSGTTRNTDGPVTILRSALTSELSVRTIAGSIEWLLGGPGRAAGADMVIQAAPEMVPVMAMPGTVPAGFDRAGASVFFGARLGDGPPGASPWTRIEPDVEQIRRFLLAPGTPKIFLATPSGLATLASQPELVRAISPTGEDFLDLGEGGMLLTGGGLKGLRGFASVLDLLRTARTVFRSRRGGELVAPPVGDMLGLTESTSVFPGRPGDPEDAATWVKCPHPLTYVGPLESPSRLRVVPDDEFGPERLLFFTDLACVDYLEAVVSGDLVERVPRPDWPQHGIVHRRRADAAEGFQVREGCGG
ncbi:MAG: hypothetical protein ABW212_12620 [Pseudonocardia sediminis]